MVLASLFLLPLAWAGNLEPPDKPFKLQNAATGMYLWPIHGNQHETNAPVVYYGGSGGDNQFIANKRDGGKCFVLRSATDSKYALVPQYASPANNRQLIFYPNTNDLTDCCCLVAEDKGNGKFVLRHYKKPNFYVHTSGGGNPTSGTKAVFYTGVPGAAGYFKGIPAFGTGSSYGGFSGSALSAATISTSINCPPCPGAKHGFTNAEAQEMLNVHNKMRCATGAPPLEWSCELQCQAQKDAEHCKQLHSWDMPEFGGDFMKWHRSLKIPAQANLALWHDIEGAVWRWFSEYKTEPGDNCGRGKGHFQGVTYAATTKLGCGICPSANRVTYCHYAEPEPRKFHCEPQYKKYINMDDSDIDRNLKKCGIHSTASTYRDDEKKRRKMWPYYDSRGNKRPQAWSKYEVADLGLNDSTGSFSMPAIASLYSV
eukprot:gnl/MRDRNA2_/MRDRNA2_34731_c0_seq1.p1 gnl/MRDRNA2_/MRDRNA2_34731_c0~~gnl/MRDRNA2_/MRDRNA2_34731_c0_seq1.p1  ORF type:complete len:455 (-),score=59.64 gnl/MRDRNA2_/MRDRNA2_34731_c0_seq1:576-1856(-)